MAMTLGIWTPKWVWNGMSMALGQNLSPHHNQTKSVMAHCSSNRRQQFHSLQWPKRAGKSGKELVYPFPPSKDKDLDLDLGDLLARCTKKPSKIPLDNSPTQDRDG